MVPSFSIEAAAYFLGVSPQAVRLAIKNGHMEARQERARGGFAYRIDGGELRAELAARAQELTDQARKARDRLRTLDDMLAGGGED